MNAEVAQAADTAAGIEAASTVAEKAEAKKSKAWLIGYAKHYALLCVGLVIMAFGVAFSIKANLGTSPISSLPYVVDLISPLSVGTATILMHCVFILIQIAILRRDYHPIQLMQLPVAFVFGFFTDVAIAAIQNITYSTYWEQWILCAIGIVLVAVGVACEVAANVVVLAGEGVVLAVAWRVTIKFGYLKVAFDVTLVVVSIIVSLVFLGSIQGVGEGTIAAALCVGLIAKRLGKPLNAFADHYLH